MHNPESDIMDCYHILFVYSQNILNFTNVLKIWISSTNVKVKYSKQSTGNHLVSVITHVNPQPGALIVLQ